MSDTLFSFRSSLRRLERSLLCLRLIFAGQAEEDCTALRQEMIDLGIVEWPTGIFRISSPLQSSIKGQGMDKTIIRWQP